MAFNLKHLSPLKEDYSLPQQGVNNVSYESDSPNLEGAAGALTGDAVTSNEKEPVVYDPRITSKFPPNTGSNPHMLSQGTGDDSYWQKFKTAVSNPFDTIKVMGGFGSNQFEGDGNTYDSMKALRLAHEAKGRGADVPDLDRSSAFNGISSLMPYAMTAQTISDAASGDLTALATKKLNKIPGVKKYVNKENAKKAYIAYKANKAFN